MSESHKGIVSWNKGISHSEETKKKMSDYWKKHGNWIKGKKMSDDVRKQMSERMIGRFAGEKHPFYGKRRSEETKKKLSEKTSVSVTIKQSYAFTAVYAKDGYYDLDMFEKALNQSMTQFGELELTIPGIPFLSPKEKVLKFNQNDIAQLKAYIGG